MTGIAVVGLGLIGGSIAAALRENGERVIGYDPDGERGRVALERGLVDETASTLSGAVARADAVLLAAPPSAILELLPEVDRLAPGDALLLDVASVKVEVVLAMERLCHGERAIGGHPLAGREQSGPSAADASLLQQRPFALCPTSRTDAQTRRRAEELVRRLGAEPVFLHAEAHDEIVARVSHVPQLVSTALALSLQLDDERLAGPGLQDMTRLAAGPPDLWVDIVRANAPRILPGLRRLSQRLEDLASSIEREDGVALATTLREGADVAARLRRETPP